jgi:hypothetical protein
VDQKLKEEVMACTIYTRGVGCGEHMLEHTLTTRVADTSGVEGVAVGGKKKKCRWG